MAITAKAEDADVFAVPAASVEFVEQAEARRWPADRLGRMLALRMPTWRIAEALFSTSGFPTGEMIEADLRDRERLTNGLCVREATWEDDERLSDLFANSSERLGEWDVTVERSPNPYAQQRLQENSHVKLLVDRGVALGVNVASGRSSLVGGQRLSAQWMGGWRVRNGFRRLGYSSLMLNSPGSHASVAGMISYWYVRLENQTASSWIAHEVSGIESNAGHTLEKLTATVHHFHTSPDAVRAVAPSSVVVRAVRPEDLPACVGLINRTHDGLDLFRPYSVDWLNNRLDDLFWGPKPPFVPYVYGWNDMVVVEEAGEIVACGGLWDRGRDARERWRHRSTGEERLTESTCLLDFGFAEGREDAMASLIEHFTGVTRELDRSSLIAPLEFLPSVLSLLASARPQPETRVLETMCFAPAEAGIDPTMRRPYTDLAYW